MPKFQQKDIELIVTNLQRINTQIHKYINTLTNIYILF